MSTLARDVFGEDSKVHKITGRHIENGQGCLPESEQIEQHLAAIEAEQGKAAADAMRKRLKRETS